VGVSWKTKKQITVSRSSAKAKYRFVATTTSELIWLKALLVSLGVFHTSAMQLLCNSQAALHIAKNSVFHERTKDIELDFHFVRERLDVGDLLSPIFEPHSSPHKFLRRPLDEKNSPIYEASWA